MSNDPNAITVTLSPKALRFVLKALDHQLETWRTQLESGTLDEDAAADAGNDHGFVTAIRNDLAKHGD